MANKSINSEKLIKGILNSDRIMLSRAITLVESTRKDHQAVAQKIIEDCLPATGKSIRIGITGTPGAGKSTFIEALGSYLTQKGKKVAVLAIDPSSQKSQGSILGDKTRMEKLSTDPNAFIRPSPARDTLGGVAQKTRESILLCEAAGYEIIFIETVGVGQSETTVHSMVDFFLLLLIPGGGDELQGIKRGIVEMADLIVINKADDNRIDLAKSAARDYKNALHLFPPLANEWIPQIQTCSALHHEGIEDIWQIIIAYRDQMTNTGFFAKNRQNQIKYWFKESINSAWQLLFYEKEEIKQQLLECEQEVMDGRTTPFQASQKIMLLFRNIIRKER